MSLNKRYADVSYAAEDFTILDTSIATALTKTETMPTEQASTLKRLAKIGMRSEGFAREALEIAKVNPGILPRDLDLARMEAAIQNRDKVRVRFTQVAELYARLRAAVILHGVDAYSDGLAVYNAVKRSGDVRVQDAVTQLGRLFKRKAQEEETTPGTTPQP